MRFALKISFFLTIKEILNKPLENSISFTSLKWTAYKFSCKLQNNKH